MKNLVIREILAPLSRRLGTAVASFIAGVILVDPQLAEQAGIAVAGLAMIAFDLVASHFSRKGSR